MSEVLASERGDYALLVRVRRARGRREGRIFEFVTVSKGEDIGAMDAISDRLGADAQEGSHQDVSMARRLQSQMGNLSPNGRRLSDGAARESFRQLYDDRLRGSLSSVTDIFGDAPLTMDFLESVRNDAPDLFSEGRPPESVFDRQFLVSCDDCEERHLAFDSRRDAEHAVADGKAKCATCGEGSFTVEEAFVVRQHCLAGMSQGLWLESLAADVLAAYSQQVWSGQMVGTNELDVVGVFAESLWLVECKDSRFGQNDLYVTAMKADAIRADQVVVLTTNDIHDNVRQAERQMRESGTRRRSRFRFVSSEEASVLQDEFEKILAAAQMRHLRDWLNSQAEVSDWIFTGP